MDLLRDKEVKTIKPHRCVGCCRKFPKGTKMKFEVWADGGTVYNNYICETCQEIISQLVNKYGPGFEYSAGDLREDAIEYEARFAELGGEKK